MADRVRDQYELYPYPARDPKDEAGRLITGSPSHLRELDHFVFGGRRDFTRPFRALVAGGGTGDGAIMLAQQLADAGVPAEVVYVDVSLAAGAIARDRARARGLRNIRFERCSLLDLGGAGLGRFDYVDCCGVLHHLEHPEAGLAVLAGALAEDGGMGLMLYGELGRTGVHHMQAMMRMIAADDPPRDRVALARRLLRRLPPTNWLRRNPFVGDHMEGADAGLFDLLLHARDRAYRVPEIVALVDGAGLRITTLFEPARYEPRSYLTDPAILERLDALGSIERAAFAELLAGNMRKHVFYVVKAANPGPVVAAAEGADVVPHLHGFDGELFARRHAPGDALKVTLDGCAFSFPLPRLAGAMLARVDGRRTLGDIHRDLRSANPDLEWPAFKTRFDHLFEVLNGVGRMYLTIPM